MNYEDKEYPYLIQSRLSNVDIQFKKIIRSFSVYFLICWEGNSLLLRKVLSKKMDRGTFKSLA